MSFALPESMREYIDARVRDGAYGIVDPLFAQWIGDLRGNPFAPPED